MQTIIFNGEKFYRYQESRHRSFKLYFYNSKRHALHRAIWEDNFGKIPKGFHIHHKDGNTLNNEIENLECIDGKEHSKLHYKLKPFTKHKCELCGNEYKTKKESGTRFCSNKCKSKWRRKSGKNKEKRICTTCSKEFYTDRYKQTRACSRSCGANFSWKEGNRLQYVRRRKT